VFLHQAVMEALVGGDTDVAPQDLRITMNKLARIHKTSKKPGYAQEFKVTITLLITSKYRIIIDLTSHPALDPCPVKLGHEPKWRYFDVQEFNEFIERL